ncbi:MAG: M48 family metallopeptidase, partial [Planctomycetia bacterium]|nr:M48 family metallopeptidase [Planctomycetia bacterium]
MRFLAHQDRARLNTTRLVILFTVAIASVVASIALGIPALILATSGSLSAENWRAVTPMCLTLGVGTLLIILITVMVRSQKLRSGGGAYVAESLGGTRVSPQTRDLKERQLLHVVEEMAIAAGIPVPAVYVLENEPGINAFAAGNSPSESVIGVTRGALDAFTRDELQGVIGHEFSHICEEDMGLSMRLMAWICGVAILSVIGLVVLRIAMELSWFSGGSRRDDREGNSGLAVVLFLLVCGAVVWLIGIVGQIFGNLIQAAISRQREFLADASAVKFTRNPDGIASALRKIAMASRHGRIVHKSHSEMSYLFFSASMSSLLATHPPLEERIRRIEGDRGVQRLHEMEEGTQRFRRKVPTESMTNTPESGLDRLRRIPGIGIPEGDSGMRVGNPRSELPSGMASGLVGTAAVGGGTGNGAGDGVGDTDAAPRRPVREERDDLRRAERLRESLPAELVTASRDSWASRGVILALLLPEEPGAAERQLAVVGRANGVPVTTIRDFAAMISPLSDDAKIVLIDLTLRTLRTMSGSQARDFLVLLEDYVNADGRVTLLEGLFVMVLRNLLKQNGLQIDDGSRGSYGPPDPGRISVTGTRKSSKGERQTAAELFLGILAYQGSVTPE